MSEQEKARLDEQLEQAAKQLISALEPYVRDKINMRRFMLAMCRICYQG